MEYLGVIALAGEMVELTDHRNGILCVGEIVFAGDDPLFLDKIHHRQASLFWKDSGEVAGADSDGFRDALECNFLMKMQSDVINGPVDGATVFFLLMECHCIGELCEGTLR